MDRGKWYDFVSINNSEDDLRCLDNICTTLRITTDNVQFDETDGKWKLKIFCTARFRETLMDLLERIEQIAA